MVVLAGARVSSDSHRDCTCLPDSGNSQFDHDSAFIAGLCNRFNHHLHDNRVSPCEKRPRRGASIFLIFLLPVLLWRPLNWVADLAHLGVTAGFGAGQLAFRQSPVAVTLQSMIGL